MKKLVIGTFIGVVSIGFIACKKEHTCTCSAGVLSKVIVYPKTSLEEAQKKCSKENSYYSTSDTIYTNCTVSPQ